MNETTESRNGLRSLFPMFDFEDDVIMPDYGERRDRDPLPSFYRNYVSRFAGSRHGDPSCQEHMRELMKDIKAPDVVLNHDELHYECCDQDMEDRPPAEESVEHCLASLVECLICKHLPIQPKECANCEVIFCSKCINNYRDMAGSNHRKCPQCQQ